MCQQSQQSLGIKPKVLGLSYQCSTTELWSTYMALPSFLLIWYLRASIPSSLFWQYTPPSSYQTYDLHGFNWSHARKPCKTILSWWNFQLIPNQVLMALKAVAGIKCIQLGLMLTCMQCSNTATTTMQPSYSSIWYILLHRTRPAAPPFQISQRHTTIPWYFSWCRINVQTFGIK